MLTTKLFIPARRPDLVGRPRLSDRLDAALSPGHRLTLVSAPAGFGKTTLLSDWLGSLEERGSDVRAGWLALDAGDNDPLRLLTHLVAALARLELDVTRSEAALQQGSPTTSVLVQVVNDVAQATQERPERHWVLVLDDYHVIDEVDLHEALGFLLDHLPDALQLAVATRSDPPWPLARLRSRGQLTEVRAADLRLTPPEAGEFLTRLMGLELTPAEVDALEARTEGWVAGLQLAALSLRDIHDPAKVAAFVDDFAGSNRFVLDYLADEVLARQPADVREFLLRTAVLDLLHADLCDTVTGRTDGAAMLEHLERGNLFLVPLDDRRTWYRYHHLFADVLLARLLADHPEQVPPLHGRAADWYAAQGLVEDAVRHALAAGDHDRAARLMQEALPDVRRGRRDALLASWMRSLPDEVVRRNPVLSVTSGWASLMAGDLEGLERRLDDAEEALAAGARDPELAATWADTEDLRMAQAMILVYRASVAQARGDVAGTVGHARRALDLAGPDDHIIRGAAGGFLGLAAWSAGDVTGAIGTFAEAVRSLHAAGNLVDALDSTIVLADMWLAAGRPSRARHLYEQGLATATAGGEPFPRATADLHVGLAELDRERGDLDSAQRHLETARTLAERASITENRHRWHVATAQLRATLGDHDAVPGQLDQAQRLYRHGFYPDVRPVAAVRARLDLVRGDVAAAERWAEERGVAVTDDVAYLSEFDHLTLVRVRLARSRAGDGASLDGILGLLDRLRADADPAHPGSLLEIELLRALTLHALGQVTQAVATLDEALAHAPEPDAYVRLFLDEGPPMLALLHDAVARPGERAGEHEGVRRHADRLLAAATGPVASGVAAVASGDAPAASALVDPLSDRELEVLRLLDSELTGPEIARHLFVSLNTLRTHTKHIFSKLEVTNRSAAVRRGRHLGLL